MRSTKLLRYPHITFSLFLFMPSELKISSSDWCGAFAFVIWDSLFPLSLPCFNSSLEIPTFHHEMFEYTWHLIGIDYLYHALFATENWRLGGEFFRREFTLNYLLATYTKPQVQIHKIVQYFTISYSFSFWSWLNWLLDWYLNY